MSNDDLEFLKTVKWCSPVQQPFLVVGYFTVGNEYETEKEVLRLSLEEMGYSYDLRGVKGLGSWQRNTQLKSQFIRAMMKVYPTTPLLYLDVDAVVIQELEALDGIDADVAAVYFAGGGELLSGTVYFNCTEATRRVVKAWNDLNKRYPEKLPDGNLAWDQRTLKMAILKERCKFVELPQGYTWIVQLTQRKCKPVPAPVIMHTRGAYRWKDVVNRRGKEEAKAEEKK